MHGIYNYIPETNHVSRVYNFEASLCLQFCSMNVISHVQRFVILHQYFLYYYYYYYYHHHHHHHHHSSSG